MSLQAYLERIITLNELGARNRILPNKKTKMQDKTVSPESSV